MQTNSKNLTGDDFENSEADQMNTSTAKPTVTQCPSCAKLDFTIVGLFRLISGELLLLHQLTRKFIRILDATHGAEYKL